jgi:hypothetical protein
MLWRARMKSTLLHVLLSSLLITASACNDEGANGSSGSGGQGGGGGGVAADRVYERLVDGFESEEACEQATAGTGFNCLNSLVLCQNSGFTLVVTDIINEGRCEPSGGSLLCTVLGPGDLGSGTELTVAPGDGTAEIAELAGDHPWVELERTEAEAASTADSCNALTGRTWW